MFKQFSVEGVFCRIYRHGTVKIMPGRHTLPKYKDPKTGLLKVRIADKEHDLATLVLTHYGTKPDEEVVPRFIDGCLNNIHASNLEWEPVKKIKTVGPDELSMEMKKKIHDMSVFDKMKPKEISDAILEECSVLVKYQVVTMVVKGYKKYIRGLKKLETERANKEKAMKGVEQHETPEPKRKGRPRKKKAIPTNPDF